MTITSSRLRLCVLIGCWVIVGYSLHVIVHQKLLASRLLYTQQSTEHDNLQQLVDQLEQDKQQHVQLRSTFDLLVGELVIEQEARTLIDCAHKLSSTVRAFIPRGVIDHGWYQEEIIELVLEGSSAEMFAYLNQACLLAQLTSFSWTLLKPNYGECIMTWHAYTIANKKLGKACVILKDASVSFTIPEKTNFHDLKNLPVTINKKLVVRGIIARDNAVAALLHYGTIYGVFMEGDVIDDYVIVAIKENSIIVHHHEKGDVEISL